MSSDTWGSWSRDAVIYEIYVRSFADSDGDGDGDLIGVANRLDHLLEMGVDAVWLTPFYRSPMADGGYDVADYREVDPRFGTLADFDKLLAEAHQRDLRVIIDVVPNHCSDQHAWFQAALTAGPGSPERELFHFHPGRDGGESPPNNWQSIFCSHRSNPTSTGTIRRCGPNSRTCCGSGSIAAWTGSVLTWRTVWSRRRGCPTRPALAR